MKLSKDQLDIVTVLSRFKRPAGHINVYNEMVSRHGYREPIATLLLELNRLCGAGYVEKDVNRKWVLFEPAVEEMLCRL